MAAHTSWRQLFRHCGRGDDDDDDDDDEDDDGDGGRIEERHTAYTSGDPS